MPPVPEPTAQPAKPTGPTASSPPADVPTHPEETHGSVELRVGGRVVARAEGRTTPAGLVAAGVMMAAVAVSLAALLRVAGRGRCGADARPRPAPACRPSAAPGGLRVFAVWSDVAGLATTA